MKTSLTGILGLALFAVAGSAAALQPSDITPTVSSPQEQEALRCNAETGSRIKSKETESPEHNCNDSSIRVITRGEIHGSGANSTAEALDRLLPSARVSRGGSGPSTP